MSTHADVAVMAAPVRRSQAERRSEAGLRLLAAAREIVAKKGAAGMTLAEVGERAGYSRGLAAHHFGNKSGLLRALTTYINQNFMDEVNAGPAHGPGLDSIKSFVSVYLSRTDRNWTNTRALLLLMAEGLQSASGSGQELADYNLSVLDYLEEQVSVAIAQGELRAGLHPRAVATLIIGALRGVLLQHLLPGGELELAAVRDQLLGFLDCSALTPA